MSLTMYHGTSKAKPKLDWPRGIYLADSAVDARDYGPNVFSVDVTEPRLLIEKPMQKLTEQQKRDLAYVLAPAVDDVALPAVDVAGPTDWVLDVVTSEGIPYPYLQYPDCARRLRERGYDGTWVREPFSASETSLLIVQPRCLSDLKPVGSKQASAGLRTRLMSHIAVDYQGMFKQVLELYPGWDAAIPREIAWAKRVLKKNDRIVWWLRLYRLGILLRGLDGRYTKDDLSLYKKALADYNAKSELEIGPLDIPDVGDPNRGPMASHQRLSHFFSIQAPAIQNYHPGYKTLQTVYSELHQLEKAWNEQQDKYLTPQTGDTKILDVPGSGAWWLLPRGVCDAEAKAMGHCGNGGSENPDNEQILSFRTEVKKNGKTVYEPHLTFILDRNDYLGEMKGRNNQKPAPQYHKAILALESDYVVAIKGGGYKPENNFAVTDLSPEQQKDLFEKKPDMMPLEMQFKTLGADDPGFQDRVSVILSGDFTDRQVRWNDEEKLFEVLSRVWPTMSLLTHLTDKRTKEFARMAAEAPEDLVQSLKDREFPVSWVELVKRLPDDLIADMEDAFDDWFTDEDIDTWLAEDEEHSGLTGRDRVVSLLEWAGNSDIVDDLKKATRLGCAKAAREDMGRVLRYAIERDVFRPYKDDADLWDVDWVATLTPEQAVDMALSHPTTGLETYIRSFDDVETAGAPIALRDDELELPLDTVDWAYALEQYELMFAEQYRMAKSNRRNREQYARSRQSVTASGQKTPQEIANVVKKWYRTEKSMNHLRPEADWWDAGGCWSLAEGIQKAFGGDLYGLVRDEGDGVHDWNICHIAVKIGGRYLDANGCYPAHRFVERWRKRGVPMHAQLVPLTPELLQRAYLDADILKPANTDAIAKGLLTAARKAKTAHVFKNLQHGTAARFDQFEAGKSNGFTVSRDGFYFTDDPEIPSEFGDRTITADVTMDRPLDLRDPYASATIQALDAITTTLPDAYQDKISAGPYTSVVLNAVNQGLTQTPEFIAAAKKQGYDGLIFQDKIGHQGFDSYVAFEPSQIHMVADRVAMKQASTRWNVDGASEDENYYLTEGCGAFVLALAKVKPVSAVYVIANPDGEEWSNAIPYEVTHVFAVAGGSVDVMGYRSPQTMAAQMGIDTDDSFLKGPFSVEEFKRKFIGDSDSKPLYGDRETVKEAMAMIQANPTKYRLEAARMDSKTSSSQQFCKAPSGAETMRAKLLTANYRLPGPKIAGIGDIPTYEEMLRRMGDISRHGAAFVEAAKRTYAESVAAYNKLQFPLTIYSAVPGKAVTDPVPSQIEFWTYDEADLMKTSVGRNRQLVVAATLSSKADVNWLRIIEINMNHGSFTPELILLPGTQPKVTGVRMARDQQWSQPAAYDHPKVARCA